MLTNRVIKFLEDGRVIVRNEASNQEYVAHLGTVPNGGRNLVILPDETTVAVPITDIGDQDAARLQADAATEQLREDRTAQARGLAPGEQLPADHTPPTAEVPEAERTDEAAEEPEPEKPRGRRRSAAKS